ncbi:hypothetical protein B296_00032001 [Ensete ventricosum]|uniref:Flavin-containing monooxygenase n=1 Tax=Ensete ventricosum TaxID=4639 RepID=A0A427AER6_ENSVE|nr:hypothetical protein B296_00032001 [Ensete ventricosum]
MEWFHRFCSNAKLYVTRSRSPSNPPLTIHCVAHMSPSSLAPRPLPSPPASRHVAVIGAGAAGLAAARELRREGHSVVVFERSAAVGGTWIYTPSAESDALGLNPLREVVHSSLYDSLRTNLPRECMGFLDYPFSSRRSRAGGDPRRFPGHREVLCYLQDFAREFDLYGLVRFRTEVALMERNNDGRWQVNSRRSGVAGCDGDDENEVFDGVIVCNGHYTEPRIADIPEVHVSDRSLTDDLPRKQPGYDNMWLHSAVEDFLLDEITTEWEILQVLKC